MFWLAQGLMVAGALVAVAAAPLRMYPAYVRYFRSRPTWQNDPNARGIAAAELVYEGGVGAVITGAGVQILLMGLALGSYIQVSWFVAAPAALILGGAYSAWNGRQIGRQLRYRAEKP